MEPSCSAALMNAAVLVLHAAELLPSVGLSLALATLTRYTNDKSLALSSQANTNHSSVNLRAYG